METNVAPSQQFFHRSPWAQLGLLLVFFFVGLFVGQFFGVITAMAAYGLGFEETAQVASDFRITEDARPILFIIQFFSSLGGFIIGPALYIFYFKPNTWLNTRNTKVPHLIPFLLVILSTLAFMIVNSQVIEWNAEINLPDTIESWARAQEDYLQELTEYLTTFPHAGYFAAAFLIIAVLPAVGEELFFRGLMQPIWAKILKNPHAAIWLTAALFSAIHFQFYGFFPRMLLGALFGYFYYWSGNLWMPILGHLINNGLSLSMYYSYQQGVTETNLAEPEAVSFSMIAVFLVVGILVTYRLWRFYQNRQPAPE